MLSSFACRALAARGNGTLHGNLPKSESNVTFMSDRHPLTTPNPLYHDDGPLSSPDAFGLGSGPSEFPLSPLHSAFSWTLPARLRADSHGTEALGRQALLDPAQWELQLLQAGLKGKDGLEAYDTVSSRSTETKLSVREQARQYEQQALQERSARQSRDSRGSLSPILLRDRDSVDMLELSPEMLLSILDCPYSPVSVGRDVPPRIIITQGEGSPPPSAPKPTPPVLRKFSSSISSYMTVEPCEITLEIIPDPPDQPAPPPPSPPPPLPPPPPPPPATSPPSSSPPSSPPGLPPSSPCLPRLLAYVGWRGFRDRKSAA